MDPFKEFTHGGTLNVAEILFNTRFDYLFPLLAANKECLLPTGQTTQGALLSLGKAMAADTVTSSRRLDNSGSVHIFRPVHRSQHHGADRS